MASLLVVPLRLDVLRLEAPLSVLEACADFTRLPWWDGTKEVNPDVANISEALLSQPFQDRALVLPAGVHLHWALPAALSRGVSKTPSPSGGGAPKLLFPAAPNRWLVSRVGASEEHWLIESDYLHPADYEPPPPDGLSLGSVAIPFPCDRVKGERPFRYLGRTRQLGATPTGAVGPNPPCLAGLGYRLTAVGYQVDPKQTPPPPAGGLGEPTFAAFYPNCPGIFGFHDGAPPAPLEGVRYELLGWFSAPDVHDGLRGESFASALGEARADAARRKETVPEVELKQRALKAAFGWELAELPATFPERTVFHARITVEKAAEDRKPTAVTVAVGNTITEALSAYLAEAKAAELGKTRSELEEQLEALHLADRIDHLAFDIGPRFQHARHDRGFQGVARGSTWTVRVVGASTLPPATTASASPPNQDVALALDALNRAQHAYDEASDVLDGQQKQLFADWYKYMLCAYPPDDARDAYPDLDEVRHFIIKNGLAAIARQTSEQARRCQQRDALAAALRTKLAAQNDGHYELQPQPATRYYRPCEPVVLLTGDGLKLTERHDMGQAVACQVPKDLDVSDVPSSLAAIRSALNVTARRGAPGIRAWQRQPWNPFALDWTVELRPLKRGNNLAATGRAYAPGFLVDNYQLDAGGVDLTLAPGANDYERAASVYTGRSLLTTHAQLKLRERIHAFLSKRLLKKYYEANQIPLAERTNDYFDTHEAAVLAWYEQKKADLTIGDPVVDTITQVAKLLDGADFHVVAQALTGFNDALLMHRQTLQLPMDEPLGFADAQAFTRAARVATGSNTYSAPQPLNDFHPIRTGGFKVFALRLVDTFGRVQDLVVNDWIASEVMPASTEPGFVWLPPRFAQPARLCFEWLAAAAAMSSAGAALATNAHPATSPICGWLLPNHLDHSLMVYDATGTALGSISAAAQWLPAPGRAVLDVSGLPLQLGPLVQHLLDLKSELPALFAKVEAALAGIHPAKSVEHEALSVLVGRPMAVVRARLKLEIAGGPAVNQGWDAFRQDVARDLANEDAGHDEPAARTTDGVDAVALPVRIGDQRQANDGVVGYWVEHERAERYATFHCGNADTLTISAQSDDVKTLTLLVDPRGVVHVTSGVLPAETFTIAAAQYAAALKALEVTFLTAPVLSPAGKIGLPLPAEADRTWSWVARGKGGWRPPSEIAPADTRASFDQGLELHDGWLRLAPKG